MTKYADCQKQTLYDRTYVILTYFMTYISDALSMVFGMTIFADCKVYEAVRIHAKVYISHTHTHTYIYNVNNIQCTSLYMYKCDKTAVDL